MKSVFDVGRGREHAATDVQNHLAVALEDRPERRLVATGAELFDQFAIGARSQRFRRHRLLETLQESPERWRRH